MTTVVGSLEIQMLANLARLQSDMDQAKRVVGGAMSEIKGHISAVQGAFAALAGAFVVVELKNMVTSAIEGASALNKLAIQTGATVENLSAMKGIAKITGNDIETVAASMNKLSKGMAVANEESKGASQAVQALGLNLADFKAMKPDDQMLAVAKAMDQFADSSGKSAIAMALYGRTGAQLLPFLKELAATGELHAKVTAEQAKQAEDFDRNLMRIKVSGEAWKKELAMGMLPALDDTAKAVLRVITQTGGLKDQMHALSADGSIEDWTRSAIDALTYLIDTVQTVVVAFQAMYKTAKLAILLLGDTVEALVKAAGSRNLSEAADALKAGGDKNVANAKAYYKEMNELETKELAGAKIRDEMLKAQIRRMAEAGEGRVAKPDAAFDGNGDGKGVKEKIDQQVKAYEALIAKIKEKIDADNLAAAMGRDLTESEKQQLEITKLLTEGKIKRTDAESALTKKMLEQLEAAQLAKQVQQSEVKQAMEIAQARQKLVKEGYDEAVKLFEAEVAQNRERMKSGKEMLEQIQFDTKALTMNTGEREVALAMRELEKKGIKEGTDAWAAYGEAIRAAVGQRSEVQKSIDDFKSMWSSIDKTAHDVFTNIFQGGKDAFTKLRDTLKATLLDLLYQMTVRKWIFDITASVTGTNAGVAGAVSNAAGMGGGMSSIASIGSQVIGGSMGIGNAAATMFANATGAGIDGLMTATGAFGTAAGGATTAITGLTTALGAIPVWGWAALGAVAIYSAFGGRGGGPKTEAGYAPAGLNISGVDIGGSQQGSQRGDVPAAQRISEGISASYAALTTQLGLINNRLAVGVFYSMDNAQGGTSLTQLQVTSSSGYNRGARTGGIENVARGEPALQAALAEETVRLMIDGLRASDLPQKYKDVLNAVAASAGLGEMQSALNRITAARTQQLSLEEQLYQLTATDAEKMARLRERERAAVDPLNAALLEQFYAQQDLAVANARGAEAARNAAEAARAAAEAMRGFEASYSSNFFSDEERRRTAAAQIAGTLNAAGGNVTVDLVLAATRENFRKLVESLDRSTESGRRMYEAMMSVNGAFASITPAIGTASTAITTATTSWTNLGQTIANVGDIALAAGLAEQQRAAAIAAANAPLIASGKSLSDFIKSLTTNRAGTQSPEELLNATRAAYLDDLRKAHTGDAEASARLAEEARAYIEAQKAWSASGTATQAVIAQIIRETGGLQAVKSYQVESLRLLAEQLAALKLLTGVGPAGTPTSPWTGTGRGAPPAYASGGMHPGGWATVGESGPERVFLPPARIFNAGDTQRMQGAESAQMNRLVAVNEQQAMLIERLVSATVEVGRRSLEKQDVLIANTATSDGAVLLASRAVPS